VKKNLALGDGARVMVGESNEVISRASKGRSNEIPLTKSSLVNKEVCSLGLVTAVCNPNFEGTSQITTHLIHCSCLVFATKTDDIIYHVHFLGIS
jgi:hypothetical protein